MSTTTFLELSDVSGSPRIRSDLPLLRIGDKINLRIHLGRVHLGRKEELEVIGAYIVTSLTLELGANRLCQIASVSSTGKAPAWRAIKLAPPRKLPPAHSPPTIIN